MKISKFMVLCVLAASLFIIVPAMASQISATKETVPLSPNKYHVGDTIHYLMTVTNPVANPATNILNDINDIDPHGILHTFVPPGPITQHPGDSNQFTLDYVVLAADAVFVQALGNRRVINTFKAHGIDTSEDFVNADVQRNSRILFPCINVDKTVEPTVTIRGDEVEYTITISNCGDTDLTLTDVCDTVLGTLVDQISDLNSTCAVLTGGLYNNSGVLQPGESCTTKVLYTTQQSDPDPLINTVCVDANDELGGPAGMVSDCDSAEVDFIVPNILVEKSCPEFARVGDEITYDVCITNTGDVNLLITSVDDDVADANQACVGDTLAADGGSCCFSYTYTVKAGDPDPLINTVTVDANVVGFVDTVTDSAVCETDIVHPDFTVTKECLTNPVTGDTAMFEITIDNTGDVNLIIGTDEPELSGPNALPVGGTIVFDVNRIVPVDAVEVNNTVEVTATLPAEFNLPGEITKDANATCPVEVPGLHGCTPGFWKNHPDCWCDEFEPTDTLGSVFDIPCGATYGTGTNCLANKTLMQALAFQGGSTVKQKAQILLRAAVSALLNACSENVDYPLTVGAVIEAVDEAIASMDKEEIISLAGQLDEFNNLGCSINAHCEPIEDGDAM